MGGASSKASRSLPKSSASSTVSRGGGAGAGGGATASRPPPSAASRSRPPQDELSQQSPLETADNIGQTGRQASPLNVGQGDKQVDDGRVGPVVERSQGGSEQKDDRIRRDAFDPDFVSQLNNLGPVNVPPAPWQSSNASRPGSSANASSSSSSSAKQPTPQHPSARQSPSQMMRILQARQAREDLQQQQNDELQQQSSTRSAQQTPNDPLHLDAPTLTSLLDEIKSAKTAQDVERIATSYDFNLPTLRDLTRRFNSPSIGEAVDPEEAKYDAERDSDRPPRMYAVWSESSAIHKSA